MHPGQARVEAGPQELKPGQRGRVMPSQEIADALAQITRGDGTRRPGVL
jgi:hypothetical protein